MNMNKLNARIKARNLSSRGCLDLFPRLVEVFRPYVGKKILTNSGLVAKLSKDVDVVVKEIETSLGVLIYRNSNSRSSVCYTVKACVSVEGECGCRYDEQTIYIGELNIYGGVELKDVNEKDANIHRSDFTAEEIIIARKKVEEAKDALHAAERELWCFGEHDNC